MQQVNVGGELLNVAEAFTLTDTVLISSHVAALSNAVPGWFTTFALCGAANKLPFFNIRNRAICDPAWNNQDTRDTAAFGMRILSIAVRWIVPLHGNPVFTNVTPTEIQKYEQSPIWTAFMPFNSALTLRVQQDEKLKANCAMLTAGAGVVTAGFGQTSAATAESQSVTEYNNSGVSHQRNKFQFPEVIDIPRRASVSADIVFSDYARALLASQTGPGGMQLYDENGPTVLVPSIFGIQVELKGQRLVQQRGQLHA